MLTSIYAALLGILLVILSFTVVKHRVRAKVGIGHGDNEMLLRAIRTHANFIEYVPISLILLFLAELNGASALLLNINGVALVLARLLHALGLYRSSGASVPRILGTNITWLVILVLSLWNLFFGYQQILLE